MTEIVAAAAITVNVLIFKTVASPFPTTEQVELVQLAVLPVLRLLLEQQFLQIFKMY